LNVRVTVALRLLRPNAAAVMVDTYEVTEVVVGVPTSAPFVKLIPGGKLFDVNVGAVVTLTGVNTVNVGGAVRDVPMVRRIGDVNVKADPEFVIAAEDLIHMRSFET
jgi:hypothetical protein